MVESWRRVKFLVSEAETLKAQQTRRVCHVVGRVKWCLIPWLSRAHKGVTGSWT